MRVNVEALRKQIKQADQLCMDLTLFALSIGCQVIQDEIVCDTDEKERLLADWWSMRINLREQT